MSIPIHLHSTVALRNFKAADKIIRLVCRELNVSVSDLEAHDRHWRFVWPRFVAIYLIYRHTTMSLPTIGALLDRDHKAIIHALRAVDAQISTDRNCAHTIDRLDGMLRLTPPVSESVSLRPIRPIRPI